MKPSFFAQPDGYQGEVTKEQVLEGFEKLGERPIVTVTCMVITADPNQNHTMVQHIDEKYLTPFIKEHFIETPHTHFRRSDGCSAQFKVAQSYLISLCGAVCHICRECPFVCRIRT